MANAAYTVDFTEATRPAMDAAKDITSIQGMQSRAAYEGAATEAAQTQNQLAKMQVAEAQRQEAALNKRVPLDSMKKLQEMFPNTTGGMYQMAKDMNMIESVGGKESGMTKVEGLFTRNMQFDSIEFEINEYGVPKLFSEFDKDAAQKEDKTYKIF